MGKSFFFIFIFLGFSNKLKNIFTCRLNYQGSVLFDFEFPWSVAALVGMAHLVAVAGIVAVFVFDLVQRIVSVISIADGVAHSHH